MSSSLSEPTGIAQSAAPAGSLDDPHLRREWLLVAWSSEIALGQTLARQALGRDLVLWRSALGLHCWLDLCVHRGAKLSLGVVRRSEDLDAADCLICPYHAWEYSASGQCVRIPAQPDLPPPAKARAEVYQLRERYGGVWVCLGEPAGDVPSFAAAETAGFRTILAGPYIFKALGPRVIENVLDVAHLGYVHAGLLGDPEQLEVEDYEVTDGAAGPEAKEIRIWQPNPDGTGKGALVSYHYWVAGPLTVGLMKTDGERRFGILSQVVPIDAETSAMRMIICINYGHEIADQELRAFQDHVANQDRVVVESQRPELLPLDLQAELHLRSDRMAIAYRKWLRRIGLRYGAA